MLVASLFFGVIGFFVLGPVGAAIGFFATLLICLLVKTDTRSHAAGHSEWTSSDNPSDWTE